MEVPPIKDALWKKIEAVLPPAKPRRFRHPGRKPKSDRDVLNGLVYLLKTQVAFDALPPHLQYGTGMTVWNRVTEWKRVGAWPKIRAVLESGLPNGKELNWIRIEKLNKRGRNATGKKATGKKSIAKKKRT